MIDDPQPGGITAIKPAVRPPLSKTRTTDRQNSFSPTHGGQRGSSLFTLQGYPVTLSAHVNKGLLTDIAELTFNRHTYKVITLHLSGTQETVSHVVYLPPDTPESHCISWRLDDGCRFVEPLDLDRKVPPFGLFETVIEGGHNGEVYTAVPFSQTVKTRQPIDTSLHFPLTQICGRSSISLSYLNLNLPPKQYDRRITHGVAGRIRTRRADVPVFYTLGSSLSFGLGGIGRSWEIWTYLLKFEKGEVLAYHHNSLAVPPDANSCVHTSNLFGVITPSSIILWQLDDQAHLPLESPMHRFEVFGLTEGLVEIYQVSPTLLVLAFKDRLVRYHLGPKLLEEQYTTALPRQPSDIFFISVYAFLVHPEKLVILDLSTGLEVQVIRNPVEDGVFRVLARTIKGVSGMLGKGSGMVVSAGRAGEPLICYKVQVSDDSRAIGGVACLAL